MLLLRESDNSIKIIYTKFIMQSNYTFKSGKLFLNKTNGKINIKDEILSPHVHASSTLNGSANPIVDLKPKSHKKQEKVSSMSEEISITSNKRQSIDQSKSILSTTSRPEVRLINSGHLIDSKKLALILSKEMQEEQEYKRVCTFHPTIYSTTAHSKYLDISVKQSKLDENLEYTFRPEITPNSELYAKKYMSLNKDIVKRLTRKPTPKKEETVITPKPKVNPREFLERQEMHEITKRQRLDCLSLETERYSPKISLRSQMLAAKKGSPRTRIHKPKQQPVLNETTNWFKPNINPNSISILEKASKTKREKKPISIRVERTHIGSEKSVKTFKSNPKNEVPSKLQLKDNIETLMTRIKGNLTSREQKSEQQKLKRKIEEEAKCTYKPRLNKFPQYLKNHSELNKTLCEKKEYKYSKRRPEFNSPLLSI